MENVYLGRWRISEIQGYDLDELDEIGEASLTFEEGNLGSLQFLLYRGRMDYRIGQRGGHSAVEFTWEGTHDTQLSSGRGWLVPKNDLLVGLIFVHGGEEISLVADKKA